MQPFSDCEGQTVCDVGIILYEKDRGWIVCVVCDIRSAVPEGEYAQGTRSRSFVSGGTAELERRVKKEARGEAEILGWGMVLVLGRRARKARTAILGVFSFAISFVDNPF